MTIDLGTPARQALIALMVHVTEASNPELRSRYRVTISKESREELEKAKLITTRKGMRNAIFHELTDEGWVHVQRELTALPPAGVSAAWLLHYGTLRHLARLLPSAGYQIADVYAQPDPGPRTTNEPDTNGSVESPIPVPSIEERVRRAYAELAAHEGDLVNLAKLRDRLDDVARSDLDGVLRDMDRRRDIQLDPDPNRKALTPRARGAAIAIGGEDKHLISIGHA